MRKRNGYVSNSSSSSYIVYGEEVVVKALDGLLEQGNKIVCVDEDAGTSGECEDFIFTLTPERLAVLRKYGVKLENMTFIKVLKECDVDGRNGHEFKVEEPMEKGAFFSFDKDYSSPNDDTADGKKFMKWVMWVCPDDD